MSFKKIILIFVLTIQIPVWSNNYAQDVFDRLVYATGSLYGSRPKLVIVKSDVLVAETYSTGEIKIGSKLVEKCRNFGRDSSNAIAHILSHELAHYYENHSWISNFTSAYANVEWSRKLNDNEQQLLPVYETQADEMGFFYSLNAGYQSWNVSSQLLDSIYVWYQLPANLPGYPPLEQRKKISTTAKEKVKALIPVFRISNYFTVLGKYYPGETQYVFYESSGYCLDHLVHENIKTPNVLNNLGVIYFLQAQPSFYEPMNKLMYPMVLDIDVSSMDMSEIIGTKGLTPNDGELSKEALDLLERAKNAFNQALMTNKKYLAANMNIAMVHFILKEEGALSDRIKLIKELELNVSAPTYSIYQQVQAFYYYLKGDEKKMKNAFKNSIGKGELSSQWNSEVLTKTASNTNETWSRTKWTVDTTEMIFGKKVNEFFKTFKSSQETRLDPYTEKFILWTDKKETGNIYTFRSQFSQTVYRDMMFFEADAPDFETSRGLKLNSPAADLEKMYGTPYYTNITSNSLQYLYPSQNMIVTVEYKTFTVIGITYYGVKK